MNRNVFSDERNDEVETRKTWEIRETHDEAPGERTPGAVERESSAPSFFVFACVVVVLHHVTEWSRGQSQSINQYNITFVLLDLVGRLKQFLRAGHVEQMQKHRKIRPLYIDT